MTEPARRPGLGRRSISPVDLALIIVTLIWGFNNIAIKTALASFRPLAFNALRFTVATAVIFLLLRLTEGPLSLPKRDLPALLWAGFLGNTVYQVAYIKGLSMSTVGNVSFVMATMPATTALLAHLMRIEVLPWRGWAGLGITFSGAILIVASTAGRLSFGSQTVAGDLTVLAGTLGWCLYSLLSKRLSDRYTPLRLTAWTMGLGVLTLVPLCLPDLLAQDWTKPTALNWLTLFGSAMLALVFCYVVWNWGLRQLGPARTALYGNITPLWTGLFAWLLLNETWPPVRIAGAGLILTGVTVVRRALAATPPRTPGTSATLPPTGAKR